MKFDFDEYNFNEDLEIMNLNHKMKQQEVQNEGTIGFNTNDIYNFINLNEEQN